MTTCDLCDQVAKYHDVQIVNGVHNTTHLCQQHAIEAGVSISPIDISAVFKLQKQSTPSQTAKACPDCGMTIAHYKEKSLLGCPTCYETFAKQLTHIIANVQNNHSQHIGRSPATTGSGFERQLQIRRLLKQLESAVNQEAYEEAASLRDQLKDLHDPREQDEN